MRKWKKSVWAYQLYILAITKLTFLSSSLWRFRVFSARTVTSSMITVNFILPPSLGFSCLILGRPPLQGPTSAQGLLFPAFPGSPLSTEGIFLGVIYKLKFFCIPTWLRIFMMWCVLVTACSASAGILIALLYFCVMINYLG